MVEIKYSHEYEEWFNSLPEIAKGRIDGLLSAFEILQHDMIAEPHGARVIESRHSPFLFVLYPAGQGMAFRVFCILTQSTIFIVNGYDANYHLDLSALINEVDHIIDSYGPVL